MLRLPALQALLIQFASFALVLFAAFCLDALVSLQLTLLTASLLQGALSTGLARYLGMPRWWLWIHLLFAPALVLLLALRLPPWIFLLLLLVLLALYWQTFRTRVPYYPSSPAVRDAVADLLPERALRVIDIGSGFGGLVLDLAARRLDSCFAGIELAPLPWLISVLRARLRAIPVHFLFGDYARLDLSQYDIVFAYLSPAAMPVLWNKARAEMCAGSWLLSYEFEVPDMPPELILQPEKGGPNLYGWRF